MKAADGGLVFPFWQEGEDAVIGVIPHVKREGVQMPKQIEHAHKPLMFSGL